MSEVPKQLDREWERNKPEFAVIAASGEIRIALMIRSAGPLSLVLLVVLLPLLIVTIPPLHDYPFHLARADILASLPASKFLQAHYQQGSFLLPNVGMDVVMLPLAQLLPITVAGRVFLALTLALMLTGTVALHVALHRRWSIWPLLAAFFLYNWIFLYGFLNYLLGIGLALWATASWVALRDRRPGWCLAWSSLMAVTLIFCHLAAFGVFAIVIAGMELQRAAAAVRTAWPAAVRGLASSALPFAIALVVFVAISPATDEAMRPWTYHGGRAWKPLVAYRSLLTTMPWLDILTLTPLLAAGALLLARGHIRLAVPMAAPLCLLVLAFAVVPFDLFGSEFGDARLPIAILLVAIASTSVAGLSRKVIVPASLIAFALLSVRSAAVAHDWLAADTRIAGFTQAFQRVPDGATLYVATAAPFPSIDYRDADGLALWHPPLKHVVSLASLGRGVFVPSTWSDPFKQPLRVTATAAPIKAFQGDNPIQTPDARRLNAALRSIADLRSPRAAPDYLLLLYPDRFKDEPPTDLQVIARSDDFVLLRLP